MSFRASLTTSTRATVLPWSSSDRAISCEVSRPKEALPAPISETFVAIAHHGPYYLLREDISFDKILNIQTLVRTYKVHELNNRYFSSIPVIDCHVHFRDIDKADAITRIKSNLGFQRINIVCSTSPVRGNFNPEAIYMKATYGDEFYAFGGLDYSSILTGSTCPEPSLTNQVDTLMRIGFDGIKMVEGKPSSRKRLKIPPFDSNFFKEYFKYVESLQHPILWHVGDPKDLWNRENPPQWAVERGWTYWDEKTYPTREGLYAEVENVLERCPTLRVIFAHFFFMSDDLGRVSDLFESYKNVSFDITPGDGMYPIFSANREEAKDFFVKYSDRILFGTDIVDTGLVSHGVLYWRQKVARMRRFLETDLPTDWGIGLELPKKTLAKIYSGNFERIAGKKPKELNPQAAREECQRLAKVMAKLGVSEEDNAATRVAALLEDRQ